MNKKHLINLLIILVVGIIAYANSFGNEFVWDDKSLIVENPYIKSLKNFTHLFTTEFFPYQEGFNYYRPLTAFLNMIDYSIWKLNPFGYHLTDFILHFITTCLVYVVIFYLFRTYIIALFLSLIFIAHPSATEAITYIPSRGEPLAFIFLMLSFLLYNFWKANISKKNYYILSIIAFTLSCFSKESAVMFPVFLFLYSVISQDKKQRCLWEKVVVVLPYFLIAFGYLVLRHIILLRSGGSFFEKPVGIDLSTRLITAPVLVLKYIAIFFTPRTFTMEQPVTVYTSILNLPALFSTILFLIGLGLIIKFYKSKVATGAIWYLTFILPVSGIISINAFFYHHWLYIPSLGILIILADLITKLKQRFQYIILFAGIVLFIICCILTIKQNRFYKNEITVYEETIKKYPNRSARTHYNLGLAYTEKNRLKEAINQFKKAIELDPNAAGAYVGLGYTYQQKNLINEAEETYKKAMTAVPGSHLSYYYLANLYNDIGRFSESIGLYKKAASLKPTNPNIYFDMGRAYDKNGDLESAIKAYQKTIELNPAYIGAYVNLGAIFGQKGEFDKAKTIWEKGLKFESDNLDIKINLDKLKKIQEQNR